MRTDLLFCKVRYEPGVCRSLSRDDSSNTVERPMPGSQLDPGSAYLTVTRTAAKVLRP